MTALLAVVLMAQEPSTVELEKLLNLAVSEQAAGRRTEALALYQRILETPKQAEAPDLLKIHQRVRGEARWRKAVCLEAERRVEEALAAYREAQSAPRDTFCGNAAAEHNVEALLGQGRCLEALGRHEEAILGYLTAIEKDRFAAVQTAQRRIVDLYEAARRLDTLRKILDQREREYAVRTAHFKNVGERSSDVPIRRLLKVREAAHQEQWTVLADALEWDGPFFQAPVDVVDAARLLAARPEKAELLLKPKLDGNEMLPWACYALGLCGTPEAVNVLKDRAERLGRQPHDSRREWALREVMYALNARKEGEAVLRDFKKLDSDVFKDAINSAIQLYTDAQRASDPFPPIPKDLRLN
jgi:tetratricopeptide (TPR) repeat protein